MVSSAIQSTADLTLSSLAPGELAVVDRLDIEPQDAALLRAMGLCASCCVRMCRGGQPCIVAILTELGEPAGECQGGQSSDSGSERSAGFACCASRIGLAQELASRIVVRRLAIA